MYRSLCTQVQSTFHTGTHAICRFVYQFMREIPTALFYSACAYLKELCGHQIGQCEKRPAPVSKMPWARVRNALCLSPGWSHLLWLQMYGCDVWIEFILQILTNTQCDSRNRARIHARSDEFAVHNTSPYQWYHAIRSGLSPKGRLTSTVLA